LLHPARAAAAPDPPITILAISPEELEARLRAIIAEIKPPPFEPSPPVGAPKSRLIQVAVCQRFNIELEELKGQGRMQRLVLPRQLSMLLCRRITGLSLPRIGIAHERDHATVMYALRKLRWLSELLVAELAPEHPVPRWLDRAMHHLNNRS
jgi:hypothetical protein